ncbi:hypothetical protein [Micromonospora nigra]|uniref:hypothetical protein n=1 Tax=Micromonospora nigra TaxID=145857 RepID=UPI001112E5D4|nr:hypothetical protein [Micromonospora nigra]
MTVLAVIISFLALVTSGLAVKYGRDQARAVRDQLKLIRDQWHKQRQPKIKARYHEADRHEAITFTNGGPVDLAHVTIEVGTVGHQLVDTLAGSKKIDHIAWPIGSGESYVIDRARPDGGTATFRVSCESADHDRWVVEVACELPPQHGS